MRSINIAGIVKRLNVKPLESSQEFEAVFDEHISRIGGWLEKDEAVFLYKLAEEVESGLSIVEIGSYEGKSTISLALGAGIDVRVVAIDPHTGDITEALAGKEIDTYSRFTSNISNAGVSHKIKVMKMTSVEAAAEYSGGQIGLLFIDGWHSTKAVVEDIDSWLPFLHPDGLVVFDDWNNDQVKAGINSRLAVLPKPLGAVGKDLAFTNNKRIQDSAVGLHSRRMLKRLRLLIKLSSIKSRLIRT
ncbi:COG4122 Predicted O-methyltransferase [Candidatus Nanopelagicaceae bacterium]